MNSTRKIIPSTNGLTGEALAATTDNPIEVSSPTRKRFDFTTLPPLSLYLHLPWCERKCPYCDFNSHPLPETENTDSRVRSAGLPEQSYIEAVICELDSRLPAIWGRSLSTIFIGGGTPSLFSCEGLEQLLSKIRQRLPFNDLIEVTMEANPGALELKKLAGFRQAGVNRLSIGVQSFNDEMLTRLGRIHSAAQAQEALEVALQSGFKSINVDLMFGLPQQSNAQALADLQTALKLAPPHLSLYQLTLEPNTAFARRPPPLPSDDTVAQMQEQLLAELTSAGYQRYEISAFAKAGYQCNHNLNYWQFGDYLALGAGAHGKISRSDAVTRYRNIKDPVRYMAAASSGNPGAEQHEVAIDEAVFEFMLNAMRLVDGVPLSLFSAHTGAPLTALLKKLNPLLERPENEKMVTLSDQQLKPTALGLRYLNDLLEHFLP